MTSSGLTVLDPTDESTPQHRERTARPESLAGLTIGLLDISKPRGNVFLDQVQNRLLDLDAKVLRFTKPTFAKPAPADLRHEIASNCDAVIQALAD